jgi:hypothetical protein
MKPITVLLFIVLAAFQLAAQKKTGEKNDFPFYLDLEQPVRDRFQPQFGDADWNQLIFERFYPVGWSKTGKFAYLIEPAEEVSGYVAIFVIQDLRTDKILWEDRYYGPDETEETAAARKRFWRAKRFLFARKLKEHGIRRSERFSLLGFPIKYGADELVPRLEILRDEKSDYPESENVSRVTVKMNSKHRGEKRLFSESFRTKEMFSRVLDAHLFGYLISPFEPRAAVIMVEVQRGWEGPPHVTAMRVIGADFENGFKK